MDRSAISSRRLGPTFMEMIPYLVADEMFYRPLDEADPSAAGTEYRPCELPASWSTQAKGIWQVCTPEEGIRASRGWKVHVSAAPKRAQHVLDIASAICVEQGVAFKYLRNWMSFGWVHHKQGPRVQGGKFMAVYPPDVETARALMTALADALEGEEGPHILGDRRFRDGSVVAYRYGAFTEIARIRPDGTRQLLVETPDGALVPDERRLNFALPEGIQDPFAPEPSAAGSSAPKEVSFEGLRFTKVLRHANGGGAFLAEQAATGETVFVKEARRHTGLHWSGTTAVERLQREYDTLRALHEAVPGFAPEPIAYFQRWENSYLVTSLVAGQSLQGWVLNNFPYFHTGADSAEISGYYERCLRIFQQLSEQMERLHTAGFAFVDVSPNNVMVDDQDVVRLVDFESAGRIDGPLDRMGTPGYFPSVAQKGLRERNTKDPRFLDEFGFAAIAQLLLLGPMHYVTQQQPTALHHLLAATRPATEPGPATEQITRAREHLWQAATRFVDPQIPSDLPTPEEVAASPAEHLRVLRDRAADALLAMAAPEGTPVFPTVPRGYLSNTLCVAYGTAGVLHALRLAGRQADPAIVSRLADDALREPEKLPPGLHTGLAGIAWVLADHGRLDEARTLLEAARSHPLLAERATLAEGTAGVALAHLALHGHDRDEKNLLLAQELRARVPEGADLAALLGDNDTTGLLHGRPGIALLDYYLHHLTADDRALSRGLALLAEERARAVPYDHLGLSFPVSGIDGRRFIYLGRGSAGFATVAARYLPYGDEELAAAVTESLIPASVPTTIYGGLYEGRAGLVYSLAEHAAITGSAAGRAAAFDAAARLFCYAVEHPTGVLFHGEYFARYSADLWSGSAGVLLALTRLLDDRRDAFFTLDGLVGTAGHH
ncbi:serine/threonine protein kinase [Kitasatospora acidiphila]